MHYLLGDCGIATAAIAFAGFTPVAVAQETAFKMTCRAVGEAAFEPLGDPEGHWLSVEDESCGVELGLLSGAVETGRVVWEEAHDKTNAVLVEGGGVIRKVGFTTVYRLTEGKRALVISDGKVVGVTATGRGAYAAAVGSAASLAGKSFTFSAKTTGPGQWEIEGKVE